MIAFNKSYPFVFYFVISKEKSGDVKVWKTRMTTSMSSEAINEPLNMYGRTEISEFQSRCSVNITEKDRMNKKITKTRFTYYISIYIYVFYCFIYRLTDTIIESITLQKFETPIL